ncbi:MAG TPA: cytochrome c peroxidase, partial [Polyangiaceae bacterium]|nr:cytochrome c peroxidase [Polyangiaceae bacterium]
VQQRVREFKQSMADYAEKAPEAQRAEIRAQSDTQLKLMALPERTANQGFSLVLAMRGGKSQVLLPQVEVEPGRPDSPSPGYGTGNQASAAASVAVLDAQSLELDVRSIPATPPWHEPNLPLAESDCRLPRAAVLDDVSGTLLVACLGSDTLFGYDAAAPSPVDAGSLRVPVASGPTGVALDARNRRALVWSQFERVLSVVALPAAHAPLGVREPAPRRIALSQPQNGGISSQIALGRRLFHAANDPRIARDGRACASCHIDGRDDGLVWSTPGGPRRTKLLAGVAPSSAPYAWDGSAPSLHEQIEGTLDRLDGEGGLRPNEMDALVAYVSALPAPPRELERDDAATVARGRALFAAAQTGCASCHAGAIASDRARHAIASQTPADGTLRFDTPSLALLSGRAPYFHDGRFASLHDLLAAPGDSMGHTSHLSAPDLAALEAFLKTL